MTFEQRERAIGMLTAGMSAKDVARHFQLHESTISRLLNRFQQSGNVADRPKSGRPRKSTPREDRFHSTSSRRNRFLSSRKLGRLLGNHWHKSLRQDNQEQATRRLIESVPSLRCNSADVTELLSLLLYRICNNTTLEFSNMIMPVHTLRGIPRTFYASITSLCFSGLQDHRISLPLSSYGAT